MQKYRRITHEDRCHIYALLKTGMSKAKISLDLGFHKSTIFRELKRNKIRSYYFPLTATRNAKLSFYRCRRKLVISGESEAMVIHLLSLGLSPEQISGRLYLEGQNSPSVQSIYNFLHKHLKELLPYLRRYKKKGGGRYLQRKSRHLNRRYIEERPQIANDRHRLGDWERDTFIAKNGQSILVCVDRRSRLLRMKKVKNLSSQEIASATRVLLTNFKIHTLTNDNGPEFRRADKLDYGKKVYFCRPQKPHQRGTVENTIGLLRQYITRNTDISCMTDREIKDLEDHLNNRPRKTLGYKTPLEVHFNKFVALAG